MSSTSLPPTLLDLLNNHLLLSLVVPFLPTASLLSLASTSRAFRSLIYVTHPEYTFRRLDLSPLPFPFVFGHTGSTEALDTVKSDRHNGQIAESVDDYYAAPLRRAFYVLKKKTVLDCVTTLILDGLAVPAALLREILCDDPFNIRILSIREVKNLGHEQLIHILVDLTRPTRPEGPPKLKGLYYFTKMESVALPDLESLDLGSALEQPVGVTNSAGSHLGQRPSSTRKLPQDARWTNGLGNMYHLDEWSVTWAHLLEFCQGIIAFDTVICYHGPGSNFPFQLASVALGDKGCQQCHSAPEDPRIFGQTPTYDLPLLPPPPLFASTVKAAQCPARGEKTKFYARCSDCMSERRCERCNAWWCENCYTPPGRTDQDHVVGPGSNKIKVYMGLCVQSCLVEELYSGAGEGGMWG
ncbi:MAG: hypothetical protein L6R40_000777 [Gallowayella cf. fulva]|nr:MAG: hypothetical protein L6R40_000777 [Xanthomendoza cf. fulva]